MIKFVLLELVYQFVLDSVNVLSVMSSQWIYEWPKKHAAGTLKLFCWSFVSINIVPQMILVDYLYLLRSMKSGTHIPKQGRT